jgi:hypothetical protein
MLAHGSDRLPLGVGCGPCSSRGDRRRSQPPPKHVARARIVLAAAARLPVAEVAAAGPRRPAGSLCTSHLFTLATLTHGCVEMCTLIS